MIGLIATLAVMGTAWSGTAGEPTSAPSISPARPPVSQLEARDRSFDRAALEAQTGAIRALESMLSRHRGADEEARFLYRLAELYQQSAAIRFRLMHGRGEGQAKYRTDLSKAGSALDRWIGRFPGAPNIRSALLMRGKIREELGAVASAEEDYQAVVERWPTSPEAMAAGMARGEIAFQREDYAATLRHLDPIAANPSTPFHPFSLSRRAWSRANLGQPVDSLAELERLLFHLAPKIPLAGPEVALAENAMADAALFLLQAMEAGAIALDGSHARVLALHRASGLPDGNHPRTWVRFAKLLKAHGHDEKLRSWREIGLRSGGSLAAASLEAAALVLEMEAAASRLDGIVAALESLASIHGRVKRGITPEQQRTAEGGISSVAKLLGSQLVKNRGKDGLRPLRGALAAAYRAFAAILPEGDPRALDARINLAETLFEARELADATAEYRQVAALAAAASPPDRKRADDAALRAIGSRFEELKGAGVIPSELALASRIKDQGVVDPRLSELTEWIDWLVPRLGDALEPRREGSSAPRRGDSLTERSGGEALARFSFDTNRALYAAGRVETALARISRDAEAWVSDDRWAGPARLALLEAAMGLRLDTHLSAQDWRGAHRFARAWYRRPALGETLRARLTEGAESAALRIVEEEEDPAHRLALAREYRGLYSRSRHLPAIQLVIGLAEIEGGARAEARGALEDVVVRAAGTPASARAHLGLARLAEDDLEAGSVAGELRAALTELPREKVTDSVRALYLASEWVTGGLGADSFDRAGCGEEAVCRRHRALAALSENESLREAMSLTVAAKDLGAIGALLRIRETRWAKEPRTKEREDLAREFRELAEGWDKLGLSERLWLAPRVGKIVEHGFRLIANEASGKFPIPRNAAAGPVTELERLIKKRLERAKALEEVARSVGSLGLASLRAQAAGAVAGYHESLAAEILAIQIPRGFSANEKGELANLLAKLAAPFADQARELRGQKWEIPPAPAASSGNTSPGDTPLEPSSLRIKWKQALDSRDWARVGWLLEKAAESGEREELLAWTRHELEAAMMGSERTAATGL